jgi:hypothetical protein
MCTAVTIWVVYVLTYERKQQGAATNAFAERFVLSIRTECLDRMVPLGESHLRRSVSEYMRHYHAERNHQGIGNQLIDGAPRPANTNGAISRRERLGGLLNFYTRAA